ncbi:MAG TPA: hypothetical protein VGM88_22975 [Kofleriaceae bacterium]
MRRALVFVALAACSPDIVDDAYQCGENASCPDGLACNANTAACESVAQAFDCTAINEPAGQGDTPDTAIAIDGLACGTGLKTMTNCLTDTDGVDWYAFDAPAACSGLTLRAQVISNRAFAQLYVSYEEDDAVGSVADAACGDTGDDAPTRTRCLVAPLTLGAHVAIGVSRKSGDGTDCDGDCAYNNYTLGVQLSNQ